MPLPYDGHLVKSGGEELVLAATMTDASLTMYFHSARQVHDWVAASGFTPLRCLAFTVPMDRERTRHLKVKAYLVRRGKDGGQSARGED